MAKIEKNRRSSAEFFTKIGTETETKTLIWKQFRSDT